MNKSKIISLYFILCCLSCFAFGYTQHAIAEKPEEISSNLQIYLPREITIQDDVLLLGQIGIARGHEALIKKANLVSLGRFSMPGQEIVISRSTILSRLASSGILSSDIAFMGAEEVTVKQKRHIISGDYFANLADEFLKNNILGNSISGWKIQTCSITWGA